LRVFKTKPFTRFASRAGVQDAILCDAARRAERGQIDADLGGGVIKQRIARRGQGKSGGFRAIVLFRREDLLFFVYGFAKSRRDNLRRDELKAFRLLAEQMLGMDETGLRASLSNGTISEVVCDD
jgi:hypothetical protein